MNILDLPPYVVVKVFSYLKQKELITSIRETCKLWHSLSYERSLWKCFDVRKYRECSVTSRTFLSVLSSICNYVESLHIDLEYLGIDAVLHEPLVCDSLKHLYIYCAAGNQLEDDLDSIREVELLVTRLPELSEKYPNLKSLHVSGKIGLTEDIAYLKEYFLNLEEIELEDFPESDFFEGFFESHEKLKSVTIKESVIGCKALSAILTQIPNLQSLDLCNTSTTVYDFSFDDISSEKLAVSDLETLCLDGTPCSDREFSYIAQKATNLQHVSIVDCKKLTNCAIDALAENCHGLKSLQINRIPYSQCNITDSGLLRIGENCKDLRVLLANYCFEVSNLGVEAIAQNCTRLSELSVSGCTSLTDDAILTVVENCPLIQMLDCGHCIQLTAKCVNQVLMKCRQIKYLNLETCHRLTDINVCNLQGNKNLCGTNDNDNRRSPSNAYNNSRETTPSPSNANTNSCVSIARSSSIGSEDDSDDELKPKQYQELVVPEAHDEILAKLSNHCHLRELNLSFCSKVTNNCLKEIASHCPDLLTLDIQGCSMVTNAGILYLSQRCFLLKSLTISGGSVSQTSRLTDGCLFHIANMCQNLEDLNIAKNHNITSEGVFEVIDKCPKIAMVKVTVSNRSNIKRESLTSLAGMVQGKILCIKFVGDVEISIVKDPDSDFH